MTEALIIFVRNAEIGKVKTRLAAGIGNDKALQVYKQLLQHTHSITKDLPVTKFVFYADAINNDDLWNGFEKKNQQGTDLGERMQHAFKHVFSRGFGKVCIIGSDCYELNMDILISAFEKLNAADVVIGPVPDGGYYLLGSNKFIPEFFLGKAWSTETVFTDTIKDSARLNLRIHQLPVLNDIDNEQDLLNSGLAIIV